MYYKKTIASDPFALDGNLLTHVPFSLSKYPNIIISAGPLINAHATSESIIKGNFQENLPWGTGNKMKSTNDINENTKTYKLRYGKIIF